MQTRFSECQALRQIVAAMTSDEIDSMILRVREDEVGDTSGEPTVQIL